MCCIFTCCGWMVDLIQRLWTFTMACVISSAVCCSLLTASMSGVALGYNYSLAEYIDLKETNVSVYLKRGVFDDEISDDMEWRRSGHLPVDGHIRENNLMTGASDDTTTLRSGRRLDDSVYESNDRSNFEGSLMRLTAKPPDPSSTLKTTEKPLSEVLNQYEMGSLDQFKAVQGVVNMKKAVAAARQPPNKKVDERVIVERKPPFPGYGGRRMQYTIPNFEKPSTYSSFRAAVPDDQINDPSKWIMPKLPPQSISKDVQYIDYYMNPTYPSPITLRAGPVRPTIRPTVFAKVKTKPALYTAPSIEPSNSPEMNLPKSIDDDMAIYKKKMMEDKFIPPMPQDDEFLKKLEMGKIKTNEDYEEEIKGVPLRKKRQIDVALQNSFNNVNKPRVDDFKNVKICDNNTVLKGEIVQSNTNLNSKFDSDLQANKIEPTLKNVEMSPTSIITKLLSSAIS